MKSHFVMMAAYNTWCNGRIYEAAQALSEEEYRADRGVFFRSMHGTLNHLLATDRIWMKRLTGGGEAPGSLDAIVAETLLELTVARQAEDARLETYVAQLSDEDLNGPLSYSSLSNPQPFTQPLWSVLAHVFNHQTHHRGQAHAVLTSLGKDGPSLDLVAFQRLSGHGMR
jgi:uncharacterized damage-inducible protein DinB